MLTPLLWNAMYNEEALIIGFPDDLAVVVGAKQFEDVELYANENITAMKVWLDRVQLDLPEQNINIVSITNRRKRSKISIRAVGPTKADYQIL